MMMVETYWIDVGLVVWCMFVYAYIHFRRLDASHDKTFLGLFGKSNESSRSHVFLGIVSGYFHSIEYLATGGICLLILYSVRNLKHEPRLDAILRNRHRRRRPPFPPVWRSSMCRQQMQFHAGFDLGSLFGTYLSATTYESFSLNAVLLAISISWGLFHIVQSPWKGPWTSCS